MSLKKLGVALLAVFVMGAIVANSAYAENEFSETGGQWYTGALPGTKLPVGATFDLPKVEGGAGFLTSTLLTLPIRFDWTAVTGKECSLTNPTTTKATIDCANLTFGGVTVSGSGAANCTTLTTITSKPLTGILGMNKAGTLATIKLTPKEGTTFATIELTGEKCSQGGKFKVTGTFFAEASNATGVFDSEQNFDFSDALQKSAGTATSLKFGESGASFNGSIKGTGIGEVQWAGKEK